MNKDVVANEDSVNNKYADVATSKAKVDINIEATGPGAKKMAWSHPNTKGGTIPGLTEKKPQGGKTSSGANSLEKYHRDNDAVKAAARPDIFEFPGPRLKKIAPGHLKNPRYDTTQTQKGVPSQALQRQNPREEKPHQDQPVYQNIIGMMLR